MAIIKAKRDTMDFTFLEAKDRDLLKKVFAFRYKILSEIYPEYIKSQDFTGNEEQDKYDAYASQFAVLDGEGEVCATVRLIYNSPIGYPTENGLEFDNTIFDRNKLGEMSRIFVDPKYRDMKTTMSIMNGLKKVMYSKMMDLGLAYTYGSLEKNFLRLLKIYKINYDTLSEAQTHKDFGVRYPSILYTERLGNDNPEIIEFYNEQH